MRLARALGCLAVAASLSTVAPLAWSLSPAFFFVDAKFQPNSAELGGAQIDALEVMLCRFGSTALEVAVVVGHAAVDEHKPDQIARQRAQQVKAWLMANAEWTAAQIYTEGKAASQPVANNTRIGRAKNRRVEVELVRASTSRRDAPSRPHCRPLWQDQLFSLSGESARVMARALVRSGRVSADAPPVAALEAKRLDLFEALTTQNPGLRLTPEQHEGVARRALQSGQIGYFRSWLTTPDVMARRSELGDLLLATCESQGGEGERAKLVAELNARGISADDDRALACAVQRKSHVLADALLDAGATRFMTPQIVVDAGRAPSVLERLLARGADPLSRTAKGATLFHTTRLATVADVRRLLDFGLDINAKGRTFPINPETTPLQEALSYAPDEVLDAMQQAGARVEDVEPISGFERNPSAQLWLLRNGFPVIDEGATVVQVAAQDQGALPVLMALRERGVDMGATSSRGFSALGMALERFRPDLVRFLVDAGVDTQALVVYPVGAPRAALEIAEGLSVTVQAPVIADGSGLRPPAFFDPGLQQRKDQIIDILKNHARSRPAP
jgi:hypothetical protein